MIKVSKSSLSQLEINSVTDVLKREYLGMGQEVRDFENDISNYLGNKDYQVSCVSSGTAALHLALEALKFKPGSEVLVPSLTYISSFQAIKTARLEPIACDVYPEDGYIDLNDAEKRLSPITKAIMPVHYASNCSKIGDVYDFANKHGLRVIEDAAHALGSTFQDKLIGSFGDIICFSFDGIKNITSGEGGAIVSHDKDLIKKIQDMRLLGVKNDTEQRYKGSRSWEFDVAEIGYRYHMSNIMAAIGIAQLKRLEAFIARRKEIVKTYVDSLSNVEGIELFDFDYKNSASHIFPIKAQEKRNLLRSFLFDNDIETGIHYKPNHKLQIFHDGQGRKVTETLSNSLISLPLHFDLSDDDVNFIILKVKSFFDS